MKLGKSRWMLALVAALLVVAVVITGCGGNDADSGDGDGASTEQVTLVMGIGAPLTDGAVALGQGMVRGANLAVKKANESDALKDLGITIETVEGDDKGDPTTGGNVATQFTSNPDLVGVMGHLNSGVTRVAVKIYNQANVLQVSPANTAIDLTEMGLENYCRTCANDGVQGPVAADYAAKTLGFKKAYVVDDSTVYGEGLADEWSKQYEADGGTITGREKTGDKDTDFKALVSKIKAANVEIVYYGGIYNSGALLAKQLKEGGVTAAFMSGDGCFDPEFIKLAGAENAKGAMVTSVGLPLEQLPKGQEFKADFEAEYPGETIAAYDAYSYDAADVIINAIIAAAEEVGADKLTTTEGRKAIIAASRNVNLDGVTGNVAFDAKGDTLNKAITVYVVGDDGTWGPVAK